MADRKQRVQKIMTQPINVIYGHLKNKARVQIWLYDQADLKIEGPFLPPLSARRCSSKFRLTFFLITISPFVYIA